MTRAQGLATIHFEEPATSKKKYVCKICCKAFKRGEHCVRHERGHTQEKPYNCGYCAKRYSRQDLLVRHQRTLHAVEKVKDKESTVSRPLDSPPRSPSHSSADTIQVIPFLSDTSAGRQSPQCRDTVTANVDSTLFQVHSPNQDRLQSTDTSSNENLPVGQSKSHEDLFRAQPFSSHGDNLSRADSMNLLSAMSPDFTDLVDPIFGWSSQEMAAFALPPLGEQLIDGFSPLDGYCTVAQEERLPQPVTAPSISIDHDPAFEELQEAALGASNHDVGHSRNLDTRECSTIQVVKHKSTTTIIHFTEDMHHNLLKDLSTRVSHETLQLLQPFGAVSLKRCIRRYMDVFQTHVPILHVSTLEIAIIPSPLVLAMCMIGAIYRMERKAAAIFYNVAHRSLRQTGLMGEDSPNKIYLHGWITPEETPRELASTPLWISQTIFLLTMFETLSGDPELTAMAIERLGFFARDFRSRLMGLQSHISNPEHGSWESWIERESTKRLLYSYLYLCNLVSILFGITAGFSMLTDGKVEMPCHHTLWDAPNAEQWRIVAHIKGYSSPLILKDAVSRLLNGPYPKDIPERHWIWDPYSCNVAVNAVSVYVSHVVHGSHLFGEHRANSEANPFQQSLITKQMEIAIGRCLLLIKHARVRADDSYTWDENEGPLLFNSLSFLRVSYCKIITRAESVCRTTFFRENEADFAASIENFLSEPLELDVHLARATSVALEGIMIPARVGSRLVKKTAAFTWAIEHAFAGWDSILLLTKCLHVIEMRQCQGFPLHETETQMVQRVSSMLAEEDVSLLSKPSSLAAILAQSFAEYYDDTWVWGVTPKLGRMLRQLADHYDSRIEHIKVS